MRRLLMSGVRSCPRGTPHGLLHAPIALLTIDPSRGAIFCLPRHRAERPARLSETDELIPRADGTVAASSANATAAFAGGFLEHQAFSGPLPGGPDDSGVVARAAGNDPVIAARSVDSQLIPALIFRFVAVRRLFLQCFGIRLRRTAPQNTDHVAGTSLAATDHPAVRRSCARGQLRGPDRIQSHVVR